MVKYSCSDCKKKFNQKSHCVIKDQSLNEFIETKVKEEVDKKMKDKESNSMDTEKSSQSKKSVKKKKDIIADDSYFRNPTNENVFKLVDEKNKNEEKQYVLSKIKQAHQILYESENIEGENAMNDIMNLIFLRLIQDKLSNKNKDGKIDLFDKKYYSDYDENELTDIFKYFNLEELSNAPLNDLRSKENNDIIRQMGYILKKHPITSQIFLEENFLRTEKSVTLQHLIKTMFIDKKTKWDVKKMYEIEDLIGEIFESFINGYTKTNSKLSQFFTPRHLMNLILVFFKNDLIIHLKQTDEYHVADFCMGTAGWLVIFYNLFKEKYSDKIKLSCGEVKPNTFQYALMNIITTTNNMPHYIQRENSLTHLDKSKYHLIITNPPFKTSYSMDNIKKNFNHDSYTKENKVKLDDVYELKDNNPPIQFLELCIYKLYDEGKCIIVLPYGNLFFGSSHKKSRQYFLDIIDITHIILVPSGVFTHTGVKTCIMMFNKTDKGTKEITFLKTNKECTEITKITSIKREDINKEPNLSFYHRDYLNDEYIMELTEKMPDFEWIEFGKVFTLEKGKIQSSKIDEDDDGDIPVISIAEKIKYSNNIDSKLILENENIWICTTSSGTSCGPYETKIKYYNGKCTYTDLLSRIVPDISYKDKLNLKFMYYYLNCVKKHIEKTYGKGSCNQSLDQKNFNRMKIPIPNMKVQKKLTDNFNILDKEDSLLSELIEYNRIKMKAYFEYAIKNNCDESILTKMNDICIFKNGTQLDKQYLIEGEYPVFGGGIKPVGFHNSFNREGHETIVCGTGSCGYVNYSNSKYWASQCFTIESKDTNRLNNKYLYYFTKICLENIFMNSIKGSSQPYIRYSQFINLKIPLITIEKQNIILNNIEKYIDLENLYKSKFNEVKNITINEFIKYLK